MDKKMREDLVVQAQREVVKALAGLERSTGQVVTEIQIHEGRSPGYPIERYVLIVLGPVPADNWIGA